MTVNLKSRLSEGLAPGETLPFGVRKVEGTAVRMVEEPDGSGRLETWGPSGWEPGGFWSAFMDAGEAPIDFLRRIGIG